MTQLLNACLQHMRTKQAEGHFRSGEARPLSLLTSSIAPAIIGGGLGAYLNSGGRNRGDITRGATRGVALGVGLGTPLLNLAGLVAGNLAGERTQKETEDYDNASKWKNWFIPGVGAYNTQRSALEIDADTLKKAIEDYESGNNTYNWDDKLYRNIKEKYKKMRG